MATVRIQNNILENKVDTFSVEEGITVETVIREHTDGNIYEGLLVECYDVESGKSYFAPIEDDTATLNAIVQINGKDIGLDYQIKNEDIVSIVITPAGGDSSVGWGIAGAIAGAVVVGLATWYIGGALYSAGIIASAVTKTTVALGVLAGAVTGYELGKTIAGSVNGSKNNTSNNGIDSRKLPDVRGAANQPLLDQAYPMVIGKHLVTPFIIGSPWNEISGDRGQKNYIHLLYAVGYAPLRLTDFKLGDMLLAHNQRWSGNQDMKNIFHGTLSGIDTPGENRGDIVNLWANNDITLEILQQGQNGEAIDYGTVYPYAKIQQDIKANVLYIADGSLEEIDSGNSITYKGLGLKNGLRNNVVKFSEQYAKSATIELDFQSGLYKSRSETSDGNSEVKYYKIPMWVALQWRVYSEENDNSDGSIAGDDVPLPEWNPANNSYNPVTYHGRVGAFRGWHTFDSINDNTVNATVYTEESRYQDIAAHTGNNLRNEKYRSGETEAVATASGTIAYDPQPYEDPYSYTNLTLNCSHTMSEVIQLQNYVDNSWVTILELPAGGQSTSSSSGRLKSNTWRVKVGDWTSYEFNINGSSNINIPQTIYAADINEGWLGSKVFNLESLGGTNDDKEGLNEIRCITSVDFVEWTRQNLLTPEERASSDVDKIIANKMRAYFYDGFNSAKLIEIRVVRVSPCYLDEEVSTKDCSAFKFSDIFTWSTLTSEILDGDDLTKRNTITQKRPLTDERMRKLCVVSLKAKTDNVDQLTNTIKKFSCIAQSFSPYFDESTRQWFPEKVSKRVKYYKPTEKVDANGNRGEAAVTPPFTWEAGQEISEQQFYEDRQNGIKSIKVCAGNDWVSQIVNNVIRTSSHIDSKDRYYIPYDDEENGSYKPGCDGTMKYCDNIVSSIFLLAGIGPHLGIDALGYEQNFYNNSGVLKTDVGDFDLAALGKWNQELKDVRDGSFYTSDGYHYNHKGERISHRAGEEVSMYFTANAYIYQPETLESMLAKISVAGRAIYTRDSKGRITVIMDKPEQYPVALINQQNTLKSTYSISFEELPSGLQIVFPDENDGYEQNNIYCMRDGEDADDPRGAIEQYQFAYVTNNYQINSLGMYLLANRILNKEVVTKQLGIEGASIGLGNLVLVSDDTMLIGTDTGARITELIQDDEKIYGFLINNSYKYTGETETVDGVLKCKQGCIVMQPSQFQEYKIITLRLAKLNTTVTVEGHTYKVKKGNTNTVIFDTPIIKTQTATDGDFYYYRPQVENLVSFGIVGKITSAYKVVKVKGNPNHTFDFTLMKYQEELYNAGKALPSFQNNMTIPDRSDEDSFAVSESVNYSDLVKVITESTEQSSGIISTIIDGTADIESPSNTAVYAIAKEDRISISWSPLESNGLKNMIKKYYLGLSKDNGVTWIDLPPSTGSSYDYFFNRRTEGYPEADVLSTWKVRARPENLYGKQAEAWAETTVNTDAYGTWVPSTPSITKTIADRDGIDIAWNVSNINRNGTSKFDVFVRYNGADHAVNVNANNTARFNFNRNASRRQDAYPEATDLANWTVKVVHKNESDSVGVTTSASVFTDNYGTWIPATLSFASKIPSEGGISLTWNQATGSGNKQLYGTQKYTAVVKYADSEHSVSETVMGTLSTNSLSVNYYFNRNRNADGYPEKNATATYKGLNKYTFVLKVENESGNTPVSSSEVTFTSDELNYYKTWIPSVPVATKMLADENGINFEWDDPSDCYGNNYYVLAIPDAEGEIPQRIDSPRFYYTFLREFNGVVKDGYLEPDELIDWEFSLKAVNNQTSRESNYTTDNVDVSAYLGWTPNAPVVSIRNSGRACSLAPVNPERRYGKIMYKIMVCNPALDREEVGGETVYKYYLPTPTSDPFGDEENYKKTPQQQPQLNVPILADSPYVQTMPLKDQTATKYKKYSFKNDSAPLDYDHGTMKLLVYTDDLPPATATQNDVYIDGVLVEDAYCWTDSVNSLNYISFEVNMPSPLDTTYWWKIASYNAVTESLQSKTSAYVDAQTTAFATSAFDVVKAGITENALAPDAVTTDKIAAGTITANKIFVEALSAISANLGAITDGSLVGNQNNYWYLSDEYNGTQLVHRAGDFQVGTPVGDYIKCEGYIDSDNVLKYNITMHASKFEITAIGTVVKGELFVCPQNAVIDPGTGIPNTYFARINSNGVYINGNIYLTGNLYGTAQYACMSKFNYGTTAYQPTNKIKININPETSWMLCFVVTLYQDYRATKIMISGYNNVANGGYWWSPKAILIADTDKTSDPVVYFGYERMGSLWVAFDMDYYTGISINDVTNGYTQVDPVGLFTISEVATLSTIDVTTRAYRTLILAPQNQIEFKSSTYNGYKIHDTQTNALYIEGRETDSGDSGGIAITNDSVSVFGAGDTDGVFRVVNEDYPEGGAVFKVMKDGQTYANGRMHGTCDNADTVDGIHADSFFRNIGDDINSDVFSSAMNTQGVHIDSAHYPDWIGSLYTFYVPTSQSGLMFRVLGSSQGANQVQMNYSIDSNRFGMNWATIINSENIGSQSVANAGNSDTVDGYHASGDATNMLFRCKRGIDVGVANDNGYWAGMCNINVDGASKWWHILSMDWVGGGADPADWCSQFLLPTQQGGIPKYRFNANGGGTAISSSPWKNFITEENNLIYCIDHSVSSDVEKKFTPNAIFNDSLPQYFLLRVYHDNTASNPHYKINGREVTTYITNTLYLANENNFKAGIYFALYSPSSNASGSMILNPLINESESNYQPPLDERYKDSLGALSVKRWNFQQSFGYIEYHNGLKIQWGSFTGDRRSGSGEYFTLPIAFSNTYYYMAAMCNGENMYPPIAYPRDSQTFYGDSNHGTTGKEKATYIAIGY